MACIGRHVLFSDVKISASLRVSSGPESEGGTHIKNQGHCQLANSLGLEINRTWLILRTKNKEQCYRLRMGPLVSRPRTYALR